MLTAFLSRITCHGWGLTCLTFSAGARGLEFAMLILPNPTTLPLLGRRRTMRRMWIMPIILAMQAISTALTVKISMTDLRWSFLRSSASADNIRWPCYVSRQCKWY